MEQFINWIAGVLLIAVSASFKYTNMIAAKLDTLSVYVYKLPCANGDIEARIATLEQKVNEYDTKPVKDAIGFKIYSNEE